MTATTREDRFEALNRWTALYGHPDGRWLLVEGATGHVVAPYIGDLVYMGEPEGLIIQLAERLTTREVERRRREVEAAVAADPDTKIDRRWRPQVQQHVAEIIGVGQQAVSRYLRQETEPTLSNDGYQGLVKAWFEVVYPTLVSPLTEEEWTRA